MRVPMLPVLLLLSVSPLPLGAQEGRPAPRFASVARTERLHVDTDAAGAVWVRGETYKARFDASGVTYVPFLGSDAPRNWPVEFRFVAARSAGVALDLDAHAAPVVDGDRVMVDRGSVDEVWILRPDSIEQTFVVEERPAAGLEIVVDVRTDLAGGATGDALEFCGPAGGVRYSEAFVVSEGTRRALATSFDGASIRIDVPAAEFVGSALPIVVDPVITTFAVDTSSADTFNADIAWDVVSQRALVVMQEVFSATDHDVYTELLDAAGVQIATAYVDESTEDWRSPRCANLPHAGQFFVVAAVDNYAGSAPSAIGGRHTSASALAYGAKLLVAVSANYPLIAPDVGADSRNSLNARYCVVFTQDVGTSRDTVWRTVDRAGNLGSYGYRFGVSTTSRAVISNSTNDQFWVVADTEPFGTSTTVNAIAVDFTGNAIGSPTAILTSSYALAQFSVSTPLDDGSSLMAWQQTFGSDKRIALAYLGPALNMLDYTLLRTLEGRDTATDEQRHVAVDSDGEKFAVIYAESVGGSTSDFDVKISNVHVVNAELGISEAHVHVPSATTGDLRPSIVSAYSNAAQSGFFAFVWDRETVLTTRNVYAGSYVGVEGGPVEAYCFGDTSGTACPCGNVGSAGRGCPNSVSPSGAQLTATGLAHLGNDTLNLGASGMPTSTSCLFFQGTVPTVSGDGSVFGDGLRCASGTVIRLATKTASGGASAYPGAGDSAVSVRGLVPPVASLRYYQVWYRNASSFCTSSTFNTTNGISVTWLP